MRIISYGPKSSDRPHIPKLATLEDGSKIGEPRECLMEDFPSPVDIPDGSWFAILEDNSVEFFPDGTSKEWAAKKAMDIVSSVTVSTGDPLGRLAALRSAASLVGISLSDLLSALSHFGGGSESLYESFIRMQESGKIR